MTLGEQIYQLFHPYATIRAENVDRFAYYTRAETAISILETDTLWMRKTTCMNDSMEMRFGLQCLSDQLTFKRDRLASILDTTFPGLADDLANDFHRDAHRVLDNTYITCLSEHDASEDKFGRLSMWRAYGGLSGVALIFKGAAANLGGLPYYASPVLYTTDDTFSSEFDRVLNGLSANGHLVKHLGRDRVHQAFAFAFQAAVASLKHKGFEEEREWRVIYNPLQQPNGKMDPVVRVINGVPQVTHQIVLKGDPSRSLLNLLDRVIVGPTQYPSEIAEAIRLILRRRGGGHIPVEISDIPLRHNA